MPDLASIVADRVGRDWCLFLDRDGVINRRRAGGYVSTWPEFEFLPGAPEAVATLSRWAAHTVIVTNQQGIGKRLMSHATVDEIHAPMLERLRDVGARVDAVLVCPHRVEESCSCRKPRPGLAAAWLAEHPGTAPDRSMVVGDSLSDIAMGGALAARTGGCAVIGIGPASGAGLTYRSLPELAHALSTWPEGAGR